MDEAFRRLAERASGIDEVAAGLVTLELAAHPRGAELMAVWSEKERGRGHAGRAMRALLSLADDCGLDLVAFPHRMHYDVDSRERSGGFDDGELNLMDALNAQGLDGAQLLDWYRRLGFEETGGACGDDPELVRRAGSPVPAPSRAP